MNRNILFRMFLVHKPFRSIFSVLTVICFLCSSCQYSNSNIKSAPKIKKQIHTKQNIVKAVVNVFDELNTELKPLGCKLTTDSVAYIYIDNSVNNKKY